MITGYKPKCAKAQMFHACIEISHSIATQQIGTMRSQYSWITYSVLLCLLSESDGGGVAPHMLSTLHATK